MRRRALSCLAWLLLSGLVSAAPGPALPVKAPPPIALTLSPRFKYSRDPQPIRVRLTIPPHRDNAAFCVEWENLTIAVWRRSCQQLDGLYEPQTFWFEHRGLPAGDYGMFATLLRFTEGKTRRFDTALTMFHILESL